MSELKWFRTIEDAQAATRAAVRAGGVEPLPPFDLDDLGPDSFAHRLQGWLQNRFFLCYFWLARKIWPFPPLPVFWKVVCVSRARDVTQVLRDPTTFEVPYGPEMTELAGGRDFVLGMDGPDHDRQNQIIRQIMWPGDIARIAALSQRFARALIDGCGGTIDVMTDLVTRVATETCGRYFGLHIAEPDAFAEWALSLSALLFADPGGTPATRALALNGAARIRAVIDHAIRRSKADPARGDATLVDRLVTLQASPDGPTDAEIMAIMVGMVVGFIPTTTLGAGRILEELLRRRVQMNDAMAAAAAGDRATLEAILWEAARLNPALQPGQWRYARRDGVIGRGWGARKIKAGTVLMVSTMSALRDGGVFASPDAFRTDRKAQPDLIFGDGSHACLGTQVAKAQIVEIAMVLFTTRNLRPCRGPNGAIAWVGPCPRRLDMEFDHAAAAALQTMITIRTPVGANITKAALDGMIGALGNPASPGSPIAEALASTGVVHFASLSVVESGDALTPSLDLLLELNVDGPQSDAIDLVAARAGEYLTPIFRAAVPGAWTLPDLLNDSVLDRHLLPCGAIGLDFNGTPEFPVADIERQAALAAFAREALDHYLKQHIGLGGRAWGALQHVRKLIERDQGLMQSVGALKRSGRRAEAAELAMLLRRGKRFADFLIRPSRRAPEFAQWVEPPPWTFLRQLADFFGTLAGKVTIWILACVGLVFTFAIHVVLTVALIRRWPGGVGAKVGAAIGLGPLTWSGTAHILAHVIGGLFGAIVMEAVILAGLAIAFKLVLHHKETTDVSVDLNPSLETVQASTRSENPPGYAQNHFMAVTQLKPGWFRKLTLSIGLSIITLMVLTQFRKGFVLNMGTIHYARWFRLPKTDRLVFLANYDGSWESYLEDFIMRAHPGQTAVWSNGVGFPRTSDLLNEGAEDGDRFKRWVRRQQQIAPFWFSRFPTLTTEQIRNNALIHQGLMQVANDTAARAWLGCFGSMQRPEDDMETDEVQSLVFSGMGDLPHAACIVLTAPSQPGDRRRWLLAIMPEGPASNLQRIGFGDLPRDPDGRQAATFAAFTTNGLARFGMPPPSGVDGLATFPGAFNTGMRPRSRVLGDSGPSAPEGWAWSDAAADGALLVYGNSEQQRDETLAAHEAWLAQCGGRSLYVLKTDPVNRDKDEKFSREHFGFRDGISQPVIRGTQRFALGPLPRDVVEPGEIILGYPNNQGYYSPSPTVRAESDHRRNLPIPARSDQVGADAGAGSNFPDFAALDPLYAARDFGRNGSFLVIRQLVQDVEGFNDFTMAKAAEVATEYPHVRGVTGGHVDADWIAAKMLGRWRDGTPLIDRPAAGPVRKPLRADRVDNDFAYGVDDPSGHLCPLGAHIRRANPRDSLQPGDPDEQGITNRHRLLRRGRAYERTGEGAPEKGLLFVALCADLERQFEFVQQTWIGSPNFHGLVGEPDPVVGRGDPQDRAFTIPTASGPIVLRDIQTFVTVKAGGYFFLPSRSALQYLIDLH